MSDDGSIGSFTITCDGSMGGGITIAGDVGSTGGDGIIAAWVVMVAQMVLLLPAMVV